MSASVLTLKTAADIDAQAREWLLRLNAGEASEHDCAAWRAEDPRHERAFSEASLVWSALGQTNYARDDAWRVEAHRPPMRWAMPAAMAASIAIAVVVAPQVLARPDQSVRTAIAQTGALQLSGGEKIYVGARSTVNVRGRQATLKTGEAFFDASNGPMTVVVKGAVIRTTGAKFNVRCTPDGLQIAVLEGKVQVLTRAWPLAAPAPAADIAAGEQLRIDGAKVATASPVSGDPAGWRRGRLLYANAPLKEVVADANRYAAHPIRLGSGDIGELRVTVSFRTTAVDELIANLDAGLPITAEHEADGDVVLRGDPAA